MAESRTILLVEDEAIIAINEAMLLRKEGYHVIEASSGEQAIAITKDASSVIDLILMDIDLGKGMDGTQAAQEILQVRDIPILFLSAHTEPEAVEKTEKITSYGYVVKTSGINVLLGSIKMAFKLYSAHQSTRRANQRLSLAQEASRVGAWEWDLAQDTFTWSPEFLKIFGLNPATPPGFAAWFTVVHPADRAIARRKIDQAIEKKIDLVDDYRIILPGGEVRWIREIGKLTCAGDQPLRMNGLCMDVTERKQAEDALKKSEEKFSKVFTASPEAISIASLEDGRYLDVNDLFCKITGYSRSEIIGRTSSELGVWVNVGDRQRYIEKLAQDGFLRGFETRYRMRSGEVRFFAVSSEIVQLEGKPCSLNFIQDITERKQVEQALHESEERLRQIIEQMPYPVEICDPSGTAKMVNQAFLQMFNIPSADLVVNRYNVFSDAMTMEMMGLGEQIRRVYNGEQVVIPEITVPVNQVPPGFGVQRKDNFILETTMFPVFRETGDIWRVVAIWKDITERKQAEESLRQREQEYKTLVEHTPDVIARFDRQYRHIYANPAVAKEFGTPPEALLGKTHRELGQPAAMADWSEGIIRQVFETGQEVAFELPTPHPDGMRYYLSRGVPEFAEDGSVASVLFIHRNITERKQAEESLKRSIQEKEMLMHELQHRVKNSLTIASSLLHLEEGNLPDDRTRAIFADTRARLRSISAVYEQLYQGSGMGLVDLRQYIEDLTAGLAKAYLPQTAPAHIALQLDAVQLDLKRALSLGLILNELITNALKYAFPGGQTPHSDAGLIRVTLTQNEGEVCLGVTDNGVGLQTGQIASTGGGGLGLALARTLAEQIDGRFELDSDNGCKVWVRFRL